MPIRIFPLSFYCLGLCPRLVPKPVIGQVGLMELARLAQHSASLSRCGLHMAVSASPGNLLDIHSLWSYPKPTESGRLELPAIRC